MKGINIRRLLKEAGAKEVSTTSVNNFRNYLEELGAEIARLAVRFMLHAQRKRLLERDISEAFSFYKKG